MTKSVVPAVDSFEKKRLESNIRFFTAMSQLLASTEDMIKNSHAITLDPTNRALLDSLMGQMIAKQAELALLMSSLFPPRQQ